MTIRPTKNFEKSHDPLVKNGFFGEKSRLKKNVPLKKKQFSNFQKKKAFTIKAKSNTIKTRSFLNSFVSFL